MTKKGVYFSFDAIIAAVIFILTIISLLSYWYGVRESVVQSDSILSDEAIRIANLMNLPTGDSEFGFGISGTNRTLNVSKINEYSTKTIGEMKGDLSTPYGFIVNFTIHDSSTTSLSTIAGADAANSLGLEPGDDVKTIAKTVRIMPTSSGKIAIVEVRVYG